MSLTRLRDLLGRMTRTDPHLVRQMLKLELMVTLWPSFPHFERFACDTRLHGIRLNSAMITAPMLETELATLGERVRTNAVPLYFDVKGRQLRIEEVHRMDDHYELVLNHPIKVVTPTPVLFKAGADHALLERIEDGGKRLVLMPREPHYNLVAGESLHIRHPSLEVFGSQFTDRELEKIARVKAAGFTKYFLSYVQSARDVDEFRELVGRDAQVYLKIEDKKGLAYVERDFRKCDALSLVAARGDMYVELDRPHDILKAVRLIAERDPEACVGSRILLSVIHDSVPSNADLSELAWLYDIGYRRMMLCDELCLKEELLGRAVNVFEGFRGAYERAPTYPDSTAFGC